MRDKKVEYWYMVEWVLFFYRITEEDYHDMVTLEPTPKGTERVNHVDTRGKNIPSKSTRKCKDLDAEVVWLGIFKEQQGD